MTARQLLLQLHFYLLCTHTNETASDDPDLSRAVLKAMESAHWEVTDLRVAGGEGFAFDPTLSVLSWDRATLLTLLRNDPEFNERHNAESGAGIFYSGQTFSDRLYDFATLNEQTLLDAILQGTCALDNACFPAQSFGMDKLALRKDSTIPNYGIAICGRWSGRFYIGFVSSSRRQALKDSTDGDRAAFLRGYEARSEMEYADKAQKDRAQEAKSKSKILKAEHIPGPRLEDSALVFAVDGITLQHVGELVYECGTTFGERERHAFVYLQALRDFALAIVYGRECAVAGSLPSVRQDFPGRTLVEGFPYLFTSLSLAGADDPRILLDDSRYHDVKSVRSRIEDELESLDRAHKQGRHYWRHALGREALISLSADGPSKPYVTDEKLFTKIPAATLNAFSQYVRAAGPECQLPQEHVEALVKGFLLTHLLISHWYRTTENDIWRVPYITRVLAGRAVKPRRVQDEFFSLCLCLADAILGRACHSGDQRTSFPIKLQELQFVLVQREDETGGLAKGKIPPCGRGFSRHEDLSIRC